MSTIHAYTNDQKVLDFPHKDLRRARAAALSIIPTTTGAARAVGIVLPHLKGKLDGFSLRVPTPTVPAPTSRPSSSATSRPPRSTPPSRPRPRASSRASSSTAKTPSSRSDIVGTTASSIIDSALTLANGNMVKTVAWYDNEWGYTCRLVDLTERVL